MPNPTWRDDDEGDWSDDMGDDEPDCMTCGGDGFVDSVAQETGRHGWDDDGPGECPNCGGTGKRKDQKWF
jgi:hypothetical protein